MSNEVTFHYLGSVGYISKGIFNWVFQLQNQLDLIWDINLLSAIHILRYLSDNDQGISELNSTDSDDVEGLKDKKQEIKCHRWGPAKSPLMVKLVNLDFSVRRE